jgi:hypothetical protein
MNRAVSEKLRPPRGQVHSEPNGGDRPDQNAEGPGLWSADISVRAKACTPRASGQECPRSPKHIAEHGDVGKRRPDRVARIVKEHLAPGTFALPLGHSEIDGHGRVGVGSAQRPGVTGHRAAGVLVEGVEGGTHRPEICATGITAYGGLSSKAKSCFCPATRLPSPQPRLAEVT